MEEERRSYKKPILLSLVLLFLVLGVYIGYDYSTKLSGQAVINVEECALVWEYSDETTSVYSEIVQLDNDDYLGLVDTSNNDIDCVDPVNGKQRREYKNQFMDVQSGYFYKEGLARFMDIEDNDIINLNLRTCLEEDRDAARVISLMEDYHDVEYEDVDYYVEVDRDNRVRLYTWDGVHDKDYKFTFVNPGIVARSVKVDDTGMRYLVVWDDGSVDEYKIGEGYAYYEKTEWYASEAFDAEFLPNGDIVVAVYGGEMVYLDKNKKEYARFVLGAYADDFKVHEFDVVMSKTGWKEDEFLFSLHPLAGSTGKVIRIDCA